MSEIRTITVVFKFDQKDIEKVKWIWDGLTVNGPVDGIEVIGVANGNAIREISDRDEAEMGDDL